MKSVHGRCEQMWEIWKAEITFYKKTEENMHEDLEM